MKARVVGWFDISDLAAISRGQFLQADYATVNNFTFAGTASSPGDSFSVRTEFRVPQKGAD